MKEKLINFIINISYFPRKILEKIVFHTYLKHTNKWELLKPFIEKEILIAGNGPSLNNTPLDKIKMVSIGMNKINLLYNKVNWRPEIIVCTNGLVLRQNKDFFNKTDSLLLIPVKACYLGIRNRKNVFFLNLIDEFKFNSNVEKKISSGCTVTFLALQIAAYLNPKSVNIVGIDHNFVYNKSKKIYKMEDDDTNHFSKDYFKDQYWGVPDLDGSEKLYELSKNYFDKINTPITDYTVEGKLKIFNKGLIKEIIK